MLFFDAAVHGQPVQRTALGIYVHLSHRLLQRGGGEYRGGQDAQQSNKRQEKRKDAFFQNKFLLKRFLGIKIPPLSTEGVRVRIQRDTTQ